MNRKNQLHKYTNGIYVCGYMKELKTYIPSCLIGSSSFEPDVVFKGILSTACREPVARSLEASLASELGLTGALSFGNFPAVTAAELLQLLRRPIGTLRAHP